MSVGSRRPRGARKLVAVPAVLLLVVSGCGARWSDEERAFVFRSRGEGPTSPRTVDGAEVATGATVVGGSPTAPVNGPSNPTAGGPAGGGSGEAAPAGRGAQPCTAASTAPGVTPEAITVSALATLTGPVPGLGDSTLAAARSYVAYRNATGGVCGRRIVLKTGDDGFENARFRSLLQSMVPSTFGMIASFAGGDGAGAEVATAAGYPVTTSALQDQWQDAPTVFDINPLPEDPTASIGKYEYAYDQGVRTASVLTLAQAQSLAQMNLQQSQMEAAGIRVVNRQELPLSTLSYDAAARAVANSKADYVLFLGAGSLNSNFTRALFNTGYKPKFVDILTAYGSNFIEAAGAASEGVTSWSRALPAEERGGNAELDTFLEWMGRAAPGVPPDPFAVDAWVSSKAFFDSLEQLSGPITRDALIAQLKSVTNFDAGGFYGPINLGQKISNSCYVAMQVVGGAWKRLAPASGFIC